jgi:hypothetical protein
MHSEPQRLGYLFEHMVWLVLIYTTISDLGFSTSDDGTTFRFLQHRLPFLSYTPSATVRKYE